MNRRADTAIPVFIGPTLYGEALPDGFAPHPPAAAGDLLAVLTSAPGTIVLIDGVFDERPSVRHKEILVLLAHGVRVIGAASMGALRAAELDGFGMTGVGAVYNAYRSGRITGDDEVAVAHATQDHGWKQLTISQVDVRATLAAAARAGVLTLQTARALRALSAKIGFRDRVWPLIVDEGRRAGLELNAFAVWLPGRKISIKRRDARDALALATTLRGTGLKPRAMPPLTPFLRALAETVGLDPDQLTPAPP